MALLVCCNSSAEPEPAPVEAYKYQYPVKCVISPMSVTKASCVQNDNNEYIFSWEKEDSPAVMSGDKVVGKLTIQSGEGRESALFLLETDLEQGAEVQISHTVKGVAKVLSAPFKLSPKAQDITLEFADALLRIRTCAPSEGSFKSCRLNSIEVGGNSFAEDTPLSTSYSEFWTAIKPGDYTSKKLPVTLKTSAGECTFTMDGKDFKPGVIYQIRTSPLGGAITPPNTAKDEFTYDKVEYKTSADAGSYSVYSKNLGVRGMNHMPKLNVNTLDRWGGYDGVKPDAIMSSNPAGYWRTGKYKGHWVMVNPDGNVTILHGVNGVNPDRGKAQNTSITNNLYDAHFQSDVEWGEFANGVLTEYGFNFYSCNPQRIRDTRKYVSEQGNAAIRHHNGDAQMGEVSFAYLLRTFSWDYNHLTGTSFNANNGSVFALMFDPGYIEYIDQLAQDSASLYKDDPNFIGYYTDNELQFRFASSSTPAIYLKHWLALDTSSSSPRAFKYAKEYAEKFMREKYGVEPVAANVTTAMDDAFLQDICDYYYKTATEALRKHDPNHLILGSRLHGKPKTLKQVHSACAKYCDVISINVYNSWEPNDSYFISQFIPWVAEGCEKPCFITEFYTRDALNKFEGVLYGNTGEGGGWIVKGQVSRGQHYQNFTRKLISYSHCIGWQWFQFTDDYLENYGWNNKGLVSPKYVPYYDHLDAMRDLHWNIYQIFDYYFDKSAMLTAAPAGAPTAYWE